MAQFRSSAGGHLPMTYPKNRPDINYHGYFSGALSRLHEERRYRVFADLERIAGRYPYAVWHSPQGSRAAEKSTLCLLRFQRS